MEGDVTLIAPRPTPQPSIPPDTTQKEMEKWEAWHANAGLSRTEAKRRYIEKLIDTMHRYASTTPEARELVEELEFVWDQIRNNSHPASSEHSSPLQMLERRDYMHHHHHGGDHGGGGGSSTAALEGKGLRVLAPMSQADEGEMVLEEEDQEEERDEFVDAPVSQIDPVDLNDQSEPGDDADSPAARFVPPPRHSASPTVDGRWRKRIEASLIKLTTEIAALREQLESRRYVHHQRKHSWWGWILRLSGWAVQLIVADAVILWFVILFMRRREDRRLEGAVRVLLGDAVATMQSLGRDVKKSALPRMQRKRD